jgi:hypothetical protein
MDKEKKIINDEKNQFLVYFLHSTQSKSTKSISSLGYLKNTLSFLIFTKGSNFFSCYFQKSLDNPTLTLARN